jgi:hypothetical protein
MYVLVFNNQIILGPVNWSRFRFENAIIDELDIESLETGLPNSAPSDVITNQVGSEVFKIYPVKEGEHLPHNERIEIRNGPFWEFTETEAVFHYEPQRLELSVAKQFLHEKLADVRWRKQNEGITVKINEVDVPFSTDKDTCSILQNYISTNAQTVKWKVGTNNWIDLDSTNLVTVLGEIQNHIHQCFEEENTITELINNAETHEELLEIDIGEEKPEDRLRDAN